MSSKQIVCNCAVFTYMICFCSRPVKVIKFISKDSIEESMFKIAQEKLNLEQQVTGGGNGIFLCFFYNLVNMMA